MQKKSIDQILKDFKAGDSDIKIIAIHDLIRICGGEEKRIPLEFQTQVFESLMEGIKSQSLDLQGNSLKGLSELCNLAEISVISNLVNQLMQAVLVANEGRDPSISALKSLMMNLKKESGEPVFASVWKFCLSEILSANSKTQSKQEIFGLILEIAGVVLKNSGVQIDGQTENQLVEYLVGLLIKKSGLNKKVIFLLSALSENGSTSSSNQILQSLFSNLQSASISNQISLLSALANIIKASWPNVKNKTEFLSTLLNMSNSFSLETIEDFENLNDVLEQCYFCLLNISQFPSPEILKAYQDIFSVCKKGLSHDPNNSLQEDKNKMNVEEDYDGNQYEL